MNFLTIKNTPEANLQVMALDKEILTTGLIDLDKKINGIKSQKIFAIAIAVTTLAVGIILGKFISITIGAIVAAIALIPIGKWMELAQKEKSIQLELDKEIEILNDIYQKVIDAVKGRNASTKLCFKLSRSDHPNATLTDHELEDIYNQVQGEVYDQLQKVDVFQNIRQEFLITKFRNYEEKKEAQILLNAFELIENSGADLKVDFQTIHKYTKLVASSNRNVVYLKEKWKELQKVCKEINDPVSKLEADFKAGNLIHLSSS